MEIPPLRVINHDHRIKSVKLGYDSHISKLTEFSASTYTPCPYLSSTKSPPFHHSLATKSRPRLLADWISQPPPPTPAPASPLIFTYLISLLTLFISISILSLSSFPPTHSPPIFSFCGVMSRPSISGGTRLFPFSSFKSR